MLLTTLRAEFLKTRRTLALALTIIAPAVIVAFVTGFFYLEPNRSRAVPGENPWESYSQIVLVYWNMIMLPLFITLETALLAHLEHGQRNWKLLFTQPVPRWSVYAAKLVVALAWIALSFAALLALLVAAGGVLQVVNPGYGFNAPVPWESLLRIAALSYLAAWFMIACHLWVATRWQSFVVAMGVGIAASIFTVFLFGEDAAAYFPWSVPGTLAYGTPDPATVSLAMAICLGGALVAALCGGWDVLRRDVAG